ncbi:hypothetical protein BU16DRAFT_452608 [Lophium mytilinum]|uniref:WSC domain-containing protein n=1 Tax=Lophium mytilinum TaxID=390894 RepID=A0A6A6R996_9PEZI|nr:hypothetical protein BU16DRAFT_452608 [Lophium mytilinum]
MTAAAVAASLWSLASASSASASSTIVAIATPTYTGVRNSMTYEGCFSVGDPLEDHGPATFQTAGNCQPICLGLGKAVMGLVDGSNCFCGDLLPPADTKVDNDLCNTPCNGYDKDNCGGNGYWMISLTGINHNKIANFEPSSSSSAAAASKTAPPPKQSVTLGASTVVVTQSEAPAATTSVAAKKSSSGPNKAAIAAGVVVGVIALAAIIAGVVIGLKFKRRREVEEEYRRQAAVNNFVGSSKLHTSNSSMNDSRLDPEVMMRRQSDGSIADNQDYSRRILKVCSHLQP